MDPIIVKCVACNGEGYIGCEDSCYFNANVKYTRPVRRPECSDNHYCRDCNGEGEIVMTDEMLMDDKAEMDFEVRRERERGIL